MALNHTIQNLKGLITQIGRDLDKAVKGNRAASQRVRTGTIRLEKVAKMFRKESVRAVSNINATGGKKKKKIRRSIRTAAKKKSGGAKKATKKPAKKAPAKKRGKKASRRTASGYGMTRSRRRISTRARVRALSIRRRRSAKIPSRRRARAR